MIRAGSPPRVTITAGAGIEHALGARADLLGLGRRSLEELGELPVVQLPEVGLALERAVEPRGERSMIVFTPPACASTTRPEDLERQGLGGDGAAQMRAPRSGAPPRRSRRTGRRSRGATEDRSRRSRPCRARRCGDACVPLDASVCTRRRSASRSSSNGRRTRPVSPPMNPHRIGDSSCAAIRATHTPCPAGCMCTSSWSSPRRSIVIASSGWEPNTVTDAAGRSGFGSGCTAEMLRVHGRDVSGSDARLTRSPTPTPFRAAHPGRTSSARSARRSGE